MSARTIGGGSRGREVQRALIRQRTGHGRRWLEFSDPVAHFTANEIEAVGPVLDADLFTAGVRGVRAHDP